MINKKTSIIIIIATILVLGSIILAVSLTGKGKDNKSPDNNNINDQDQMYIDENGSEDTDKPGDNKEENTGDKNNSESGNTGNSDQSNNNNQENNNSGNDLGDKGNDDNDKSENDSSGDVTKREIKPVKVRALYLSGPSAGKSSIIDKVIELAKTTELNAVVIDVKEAGVVNYKSDVPEVKNNGLYVEYYDPASLIKKLHDNNIYVIGRIVCFLDNGLGTKRADLAIKRKDGTPWKEGRYGVWVNPYNEEVRKYNIDIAKEAVEKGFDEIQFDYVRFPSGTGNKVDYGSDVPTKSEIICEFLRTAKRELNGVFVSADVFGIICLDKNTKNTIGQDLETVGLDIDYICPMVYPSHYANASKNHYTGNGVGQNINGILFTAPDLEPYKVVYNTLLVAKDRISKVNGYKAKVRPYLQSFTASYLPKGYYMAYGAEEVRQQIKAVYDAGFEEWILWNSENIYPDGAFEKK